MSKVLEMRKKRGQLVDESRTILDSVPAGSEMTGEQRSKYDAMNKDIDKLAQQIKDEERQSALDDEMKAINNRLDTRTAPESTGAAGVHETSPEQRAAFEKYIKRGFVPAQDEFQKRAMYLKYLRSGYNGLNAEEQRTMVAGTDSLGGYMMTPQTLAAEILMAADASLLLRQMITVIPIGKSESLGIVTVDTDVTDADWTAELETGDESDIYTGKRELKPHPLAKRLTISNKLLNSSFNDIGGLIVRRLGYKVSVSMEKAYMVGDGVNKPLGMFIANADGIPTAQNVDCAGIAALTGDNMIDMQHKIRQPYRINAKWVLHTDILARVRKLKDAVTGQYLWQPGLMNNQPDVLLGKQIVESEFAPSAVTNTSNIAVYGDLKNYTAVDSLTMFIQVLKERYAELNKTGYIIRNESDGQPTMGEAFSRLHLTA